MQTKSLFSLGKLVAPLSLVATVALCLSAPAQAISLGDASNYNVFILGNLNQSNTDIEGKLAVNGDVNLSNFSIGTKLPDNSGNVLIAGGDLNLTNVQVNHGDAVYHGTASLINSTIRGGQIKQDNPIDFNAAGTYLGNLSSSLSKTVANGTTSIYSWGEINLAGKDSKLNVFNLNGTDLAKATSFKLDAPQDSTVVVNISGSDISMGGFDFFFKNIDKQHILYNFYEATNLTSNGLGIKGSVLAPNANFTFHNGHIDGNLIANSLTGQGESHDYLFEGALPDFTPISNEDPISKVPEPATLAGLGLVAATGVGSRRKGNQKV